MFFYVEKILIVSFIWFRLRLTKFRSIVYNNTGNYSAVGMSTVLFIIKFISGEI